MLRKILSTLLARRRPELSETRVSETDAHDLLSALNAADVAIGDLIEHAEDMWLRKSQSLRRSSPQLIQDELDFLAQKKTSLQNLVHKGKERLENRTFENKSALQAEFVRINELLQQTQEIKADIRQFLKTMEDRVRNVSSE